GAAIGAGRELVFENFDVPGALADHDAGERSLILRLELGLREGVARERQREHRRGQDEAPRPGGRSGRRKRKGDLRAHVAAFPRKRRWCRSAVIKFHLSKNSVLATTDFRIMRTARNLRLRMGEPIHWCGMRPLYDAISRL